MLYFRKLRFLEPRIHRLTIKAERSLHVPYFGFTAWHYGINEVLGIVSASLFVASLIALLAEDSSDV